MQGRTPEVELENTMVLDEIHRPSPALMGRATQTLCSDDLVDENVNEEVEMQIVIPSKSMVETSRKKKRQDDSLSLEVEDLDDSDDEDDEVNYKTQEACERAKLKKRKRDENLVIKSLKCEINDVRFMISQLTKKKESMEYNLMRLMKKQQRKIQRETPTPSQLQGQSIGATPSMSMFTVVKEDIAKIKDGMNDLELKVQLTYNNTVDMPGLADKVTILAVSHATLFTLLQDIHDAKRGEKSIEEVQYMLLRT